MCLVELTVRPVMGRCGNGTGWGSRADHLAVTRERGVQFDTYFKIDLTVPVNRDMSTCPWHLLGADDRPDGATGVWNDLREFRGTRATAHNRKWLTAVLFESDVVFHAGHPNSEGPRSATRPTYSERRIARIDVAGQVSCGGKFPNLPGRTGKLETWRHAQTTCSR